MGTEMLPLRCAQGFGSCAQHDITGLVVKFHNRSPRYIWPYGSPGWLETLSLNGQHRLFFCFYSFISLCGNGWLRAAVAYEEGGDDCDYRQDNADMEGILHRQDARLPLYQPTDHLDRGSKGCACRCSSQHEERL
jgi:hypothetical protein